MDGEMLGDDLSKIIYTLLLIQSEQVRNHTELAALAEA